MNDDVRQTLIRLYTTRPEMGRQVRLCKGMLEDYHRGPEVKVLRDAVELGVVDRLLQRGKTVPATHLVASLGKELQDKFCINEAEARWAVVTWALATKVISESDRRAIEEQSTTIPVPAKKRWPVTSSLLVTVLCAALYFIWHVNDGPIIDDMVISNGLSENGGLAAPTNTFYHDDPSYRAVSVVASYQRAKPSITVCTVELLHEGEILSTISRTLQASAGRLPVVYPQKLAIGSYEVRFAMERRSFPVAFKVLPGLHP